MDAISPQENFITPRKKWFKKPLVIALAVVLIVVGYFAVRFGLIYSTIVISSDGGQQDIINNDKRYPMPSQESSRLDVLILGMRGTSPKEIEEEGGLLTDTIQVVSVDRSTSKASVISIPRDLYVSTGEMNGKINEAYERGLAKGQGLGFVKTVVSKITGVYIDKAIVFDFNAFQTTIDKIGGIEITLAKPFIESTQWGHEFSLPAGANHLNGQTALYYVRSRYSTSDFDRARRQQQVITAIRDKVEEEGYLTNPVKITGLLNLIKNDIKTDFQIWDISDLTKVASQFKSDSQIKNYVIDTTNLVYETKSSQGEYILLPKGDNYDGLKQFFQDALKQESSPSPIL